jgi:FkbM family methyltransferase
VSIVDLARRTVDRTINRLGYNVVRLKRTNHNPFNLLELLVGHVLAQQPDFFFIQVGAADGLENDLLRPSVVRHGLRGLLIEPLPHSFDSLKKNYANQPGLMFENCAIADVDGPQTMFRIRDGAPFPPVIQQLASFDRHNLSTARQGWPGLDNYVESVTVPGRTLRSLTSQHGISHVSLLLVDTEGYDAKVVEAAIAQGLAPSIIVYEHVHLPSETQYECTRLLKQHDYQFIEMGLDTYAVQKSLIPA